MNQTSDDHLPISPIRPRFQIETTDSPQVLADKIRASLKSENARCKGRIKHGYATLYLPNEERHYWSPELTLTIEESESGALLRGLYGPRPAVWTMFVFFYSLIAFSVLIVGIIGLANLSIDKSGAILWLIPFLIIIFLTLYLVAYFGQKIGHDQMVVLHTFIEESTGLVIR